jgi:hypothetical protein
MRPIFSLAAALTLAAVLLPHQGQAESDRQPAVYRSLCEASAAVAIDNEHFAVADDESNILRIFKKSEPLPVSEINLNEFLDARKGADLEGAARFKDRIYWISSHGRNKHGEAQKRRLRFFATRVKSESPPALVPEAAPYTGLLDDLINNQELAKYKLGCAAELAPEEPGGLNIEGLAAAPNGDLLIGFRNPVRLGKALIVPLKNPAALLEGGKAKFGTPIELDLGRRGIRSIELVGDIYWILAGPPGESGSFALYRWRGKAEDPPIDATSIDLGGLSPEGLFAWPDKGLEILSDDGAHLIGGKPCKTLGPAAQEFRALTIRP